MWPHPAVDILPVLAVAAVGDQDRGRGGARPPDKEVVGLTQRPGPGGDPHLDICSRNTKVTHRDTQRETERDRETQRERDTHTQRERERERERERGSTC